MKYIIVACVLGLLDLAQASAAPQPAPIRFYVLSKDSINRTGFKLRDAQNMVARINRDFRGRVHFSLQSFQVLAQPSLVNLGNYQKINQAFDFFHRYPTGQPTAVNVAIVGSIMGNYWGYTSGGAIPPSGGFNAVSLIEVGHARDGWIPSHEFGHVVGFSHTAERGINQKQTIQSRGCHGTRISSYAQFPIDRAPSDAKGNIMTAWNGKETSYYTGQYATPFAEIADCWNEDSGLD